VDRELAEASGRWCEVNVSPVLIYMLTAETLAVNELFQRKAIQFGDDLFGIGFRARPRLAGRGVTQSDDRGDRSVRRKRRGLAHPVVFVGSDRVRAAADAKSPRRDHHVLRDATGVETQAFVVRTTAIATAQRSRFRGAMTAFARSWRCCLSLRTTKRTAASSSRFPSPVQPQGSW